MVNDESLGNVFSWLCHWVSCKRFEAGNRVVNDGRYTQAERKGTTESVEKISKGAE